MTCTRRTLFVALLILSGSLLFLGYRDKDETLNVETRGNELLRISDYSSQPRVEVTAIDFEGTGKMVVIGHLDSAGVFWRSTSLRCVQ